MRRMRRSVGAEGSNWIEPPVGFASPEDRLREAIRAERLIRARSRRRVMRFSQ